VKTVCDYCDKTFLDKLEQCPHCFAPQMDLIEHALLIVEELKDKQRRDNHSVFNEDFTFLTKPTDE
jgi:hypothetical protein